MTELERLCDRLMAFEDRMCRGGGRLDVLEESYELLKELRADNARLLGTLAEYMATPDDGVEVDVPPMQLRPELQPCGHPVQAIRSTPYIGDQHSNYCGWCADVAQFEHELCQTLTAELLAYREKVARLREALGNLIDFHATAPAEQTVDSAVKFSEVIHRGKIALCPADDWRDDDGQTELEMQVAWARDQERERCAELLDEKELERRNAATRAEAMKEERCIVLALEVEADEFAELATAIREGE